MPKFQKGHSCSCSYAATCNARYKNTQIGTMQKIRAATLLHIHMCMYNSRCAACAADAAIATTATALQRRGRGAAKAHTQALCLFRLQLYLISPRDHD